MNDNVINPRESISQEQNSIPQKQSPPISKKSKSEKKEISIESSKKQSGRGTKLLFARLSLLFRHGEWYSDKKINNTISDLKNPESKLSEKKKVETLEKIIVVLNKLSKLKNYDKEKEEIRSSFNGDSKAFSLLKDISVANEKLLFHIHADEYGANNKKLEGYNFENTISYMLEFLEARKKAKLDMYGLPNSLIKELSLGLKLSKIDNKEEFVESIQKSLEKNSEDNFLIPGGWAGRPSGHAMFYELIPQDDGKFTFRIFNLGDGVSGDVDASNYKTKAPPYVDFEGISKQHLMDKNTLGAIFELKRYATFPQTESKTNFNADNIYGGLKSLLNPENISTPEDSKTAQRSGVCSWRSLMAVISSHTTKDEYKRFACDIKMQSLIHRNWEELLKTDEKGKVSNSNQIPLLEKAHAKLARKIDKLAKQDIVDNKYLFQAEAYLNRIETLIKNHKVKAYKRPLEKVKVSKPFISEKMDSSKLDSAAIPLHKQATSIYQASGITIDGNLISSIHNYKPDQVIHLCQSAIDKKDFLTANIALKSYIMELKIPPSSSPQELKALTNDLAGLSKLYFDTCLLVPHAEIVLPERLVVLQKIFSLQTEVASKVEPSSKNLRLYSFTNSIFFNPHEHYQKNSEWEYRKATVSPKNSTSMLLSSYYKPTHFLSDPEQYFEAGHSYHREKPHMQAAMLLTNDSTPSWFRGLRDTALFLKYLEFGDVANPLDGKTSFPLNFEIRDENQYCIIDFSIASMKGVLKDHPNVEKNKAKDTPNIKSTKNSNMPHNFMLAYPAFQSAEMEKLITFFIKKAKDVKTLLSSDLKELKVNIPADEVREIAHVFTKENKVAEGFEYFWRHPDKLSDPDYQILFEIFFLNGGYLSSEVNKGDFSNKLNDFLETQINQSINAHDIKKMAFLIRMTRVFNKQNDKILDSSPLLTNLVQLPGLSFEEKSILYAELVASLSKKKDLNPQEVEDLIAGYAFIMQNPKPESLRMPQQEHEIQEALHIHNVKIKEALAADANGKILNRLVREIYNKQDHLLWSAISVDSKVCYQSSDSSIIFDPNIGKMLSNKHSVFLPLAISQNVYFTRNFKGIDKGTHLSNNVYSFTDKGKEVLVKLENDELIIERKEKGSWCRFIPEETFSLGSKSSFLGSRHLMQNFFHWQNLDNPSLVFLTDKQTGDTVYQAEITNNEVTKIVDTKNQQTLMAPSHLLTHFEDANYIQEWSSDLKEVNKVELPRFNLSFERGLSKPNLWKCTEYPGFFLCQNQQIPLLGVYKDYLVLENSEGERKVLIPEYAIKSPEQKNAAFIEFEVDRFLEPQNRGGVKCHVFNLGDAGALESKSVESKYFLASVLGVSQEYTQAAANLKKFGQKLLPYSSDERKFLASIASIQKTTGDASGNGLALQLYSSYLLLRNGLDNNINVAEFTVDELSDLYQNYLAHYNNATALKLTPNEEIFLLKHILNEQFNPILYLRLQKLDPAYAQTLMIPESTADSRNLEFEFRNLNFKLPVMGAFNALPPFNKLLISRIDSYIYENPIEFFHMLSKATGEEKKWLQDALTFAIGSSKTASYALIFEDIIRNPTMYREPPIFQQGGIGLDKFTKQRDFENQFDSWWKDVKSIALQNIQNSVLLSSKIPFKISSSSQTVQQGNKPSASKVVPNFKVDTITSFQELCLPHIASREIKPDNDGLSKWLAGEIANPVSQETLYINEMKRLQEDIKAQKNITIHNISDISRIENILNENKDQNKLTLDALEIDILSLANRSADSFADTLLERIQHKGQLRRVVTLEDVMISFARKDPQTLLGINPNIEPIINELYEKIGNYLLLSTHEQQRERAINSLEKLKTAGPDEKQDYEQELSACLLAKRSYNPIEHPAYLVFEYYANAIMRPQQIIKLQNFIDNKDENMIMEMIMGSGKSKFLVPLLGLLRADGQKISMVVVPQSLFESVAGDTQKTLLGAFSQSTKTLNFNRHTEFNKATLERIKDDLINIKENKECLLITSKSIQSLLLKFAEESINQKGVLTEELILMRDILAMFAHSHPIIDEVDSILNIRHEVCFCTGKDKKPADTEIGLIGQMYSIVYGDQEINQLVRIESHNNTNANAMELTEKNYHASIKPRLAEKCLDATVLKEIGKENRKLALDYLCQENVVEAQTFFNSLSPEKQNYLNLASQELNDFLPHTLTKICGEKYGMDDKGGGDIAIPFAAANTPSHGSQFSVSYITMNYTFQYYVKNGISQKILLKQLQDLQARAMTEMKEIGQGARIEDTEAWKLFKNFCDDVNIPLFNVKDAHVELLAQHINADTDRKVEFVQKLILPKMTISEKKISCNPLDFISFFDNASGFTGTLWNQHSMHSKLKSVQDPGIDSKTINLIWNMSKGNLPVIDSVSPQAFLGELMRENLNIDLIVDTGGYLKEGGTTAIAKQMATTLGKPVVFYNDKNQQAIIEDGKEVLLDQSNVPVDKRYNFLDQSHTTGADLPYKRDALGIITIGRDMLLRDLLQGVWRFRGLDKSQKIECVISNEVKEIVCQALGKDLSEGILYPDILRFLILNQIKAQGQDNFTSLVLEMDSIVKGLLFKAMMSEDFTEDMRKQTLEEIEGFWVQNTNELIGALSTKESSDIVVNKEIVKFAAIVKKLQEKLPFFAGELQNLQDNIQEQAKSIGDLLPKEMTAPLQGANQEQIVEVETQQETQQETQVEVEVNQEVDSSRAKLDKISVYDDETFVTTFDKLDELEKPPEFFNIDNSKKYFSLPIFGIETFFDTDPELKGYSNAFSGVAMTLNVLQWDDLKNQNFKLFGANRTPFHQIEFIDGKAFIRSNDDLKSYENANVYNLGFGFYDSKQQLTKEQELQIVKIKFLNGESYFTKKETEILKSWIQTNDPKKMFDLMQTQILPGMPSKTVAFNSDSTLLKVFKEFGV